MLVGNTNRKAFEIRYNNYKRINDHQVLTKVSCDCNSGLYLYAVEPALEAITAGWLIETKATLITSEDISGSK